MNLLEQFKKGILLLLVSIDCGDEIRYFCNAGEDIEWNGHLYKNFPFSFSRPKMGDDADGSGNLTISAVDMSIIKLIREQELMGALPTLSFDALYVVDDESGGREITHLEGYKFALQTAGWNAISCNFTLQLNIPLQRKFPRIVFNSQNNPGGAL